MANKSGVLGEVELDLKDKQLLYYLSLNYRLSLSHLARLLKVSRETVKYRLDRLEERGLLYGSNILINPHYIASFPFMIAFQFHKLDIKEEEKFVAFLVKHPNTFRVIKCSGKWDLLVWVFAENTFEFNKILMEFRNKSNNFLKEFDFMTFVKEYKYIALSPSILEGSKTKKIHYKRIDFSFGRLLENVKIELEPKIEKKKLDETDIRILELLSEDCRMQLNHIAKELKTSNETVKYRIGRMIKEGILQGFWPLVDVSKIGLQWYVLLIQLQNLSKEKEEELEKYFKNNPYILWALRVNGRWDVLVDINAKSLEHFSSVMTEIRRNFSEIIADYDSVLMLEQYKYTHFVKAYYDVVSK